MDTVTPGRPSFRARAAAEVRAELARQQVSARKLAADLGETHTWATRRVKGVVPMSTDDLERIASYLGVPMARLLGDAMSWTPDPDGPSGPGALSRANASSAFLPSVLVTASSITDRHAPLAPVVSIRPDLRSNGLRTAS